jgi:transglutaminase-like putative cysteine protease
VSTPPPGRPPRLTGTRGRLPGAATLAVGTVALSTAWADPMAAAALGACVLLPYGWVPLAVRLRLPVALAVSIVLTVTAAASYGIAVTSSLTPASLVFDAVPRLLTAPRPAPATPDLLAAGGLLGVVVGLFTGVRAARPRGGGYAPVVGGVVLYLAGALLTAGASDRYGLLALGLLACAVSVWTARERSGPRRILSVLPSVAVGMAVLVAVATVAPARDPFEPRELVLPPPLPMAERNPLPRLAAYADQGDVELFRYASPGVGGAAGGRRLHLVALVDFDGASWQASARYRPLGVVPPAGLPPGPDGEPITTEVTVAGLDGIWLPAVGRPTAVDLREANVDAQSGALAIATGLRPGLRYRVRSLLDPPRAAGLAVAQVPPGDDELAAPYREVPRLPFLFAEYARRTIRGAGTPFEQAVLIENAVRTSRRLNPEHSVGSSYARLEAFLFAADGQPGAQVGGPEQFSAAFAVLARAVGLPTRLMVGFRPGTPESDGTRVVRGRDAFVWPEVYFQGEGWVPFDPTPVQPDGSGPGAELKRQVLDRLAGVEPREAPPPPSPLPPRIATPTSAPPVLVAPPSTGTGGWSPLTTAGIAGMVALLLLGASAVARATRRARHRRAGPRGAWAEVLDLLLLIGRPPPRWRTATWIAEDLSAAFPARPVLDGAHPALRLATHADRAAFAPPGSAEAASWADLRRLRRLVRRAVPWYRRLLWPLDPRPLLRR